MSEGGKDTAGDKFEAELAIEPKGQAKERAVAGNAVRDHLLRQGDAFNFGKAIKLGKIGDFTMEAIISTRQYVGDQQGVVFQPILRGDGAYSPDTSMLITAASDGVGIMRRYENLMLAVAQRERGYIAALTSKRDSLVKTRAQTVDRPFPKQAALDATREKFKKLEGDLRVPGQKPANPSEVVPPPDDDVLAMAGGSWRDDFVTVDVDGRPAVVKAGTAVDFLNARIKAVRLKDSPVDPEDLAEIKALVDKSGDEAKAVEAFGKRLDDELTGLREQLEAKGHHVAAPKASVRPSW